MALYDLAYVLFVAVTDRTLSPLRGRLAGLREWRALPPRGRRHAPARAARAADRAARRVAPARGVPRRAAAR